MSDQPIPAYAADLPASGIDPGSEPGDICNQRGDIRPRDLRPPIGEGEVWVTPSQSISAMPFGWEIRGYQDGLVKVGRHI